MAYRFTNIINYTVNYCARESRQSFEMQLVSIESRIRISERKAWTVSPVCPEYHRCWTSIERVQWADISPTCVNRSWFVEEAREIGRNVRSPNLLSFDCSTLVARTGTHRVIRRIIDNRSTNKLCMRWTRFCLQHRFRLQILIVISRGDLAFLLNWNVLTCWIAHSFTV